MVRLLHIGLNWTELNACRTLAGCRRQRPLSRSEPGNGMAARRFSRTDGKEFARQTLTEQLRSDAAAPSGLPDMEKAWRRGGCRQRK
jgi:hypothetical protein